MTDPRPRSVRGNKELAAAQPPPFERHTLGSQIRGARLGFRWIPSLHRYVRVTDGLDGRNGFVVEVVKPSGLSATSKKGEYRVWWDSELFPEIEELARRLGDGRHVCDEHGGVHA